MRTINKCKNIKDTTFKSKIINELINTFDSRYEPVNDIEAVSFFDDISQFFLVFADQAAEFHRPSSAPRRYDDDYIIPMRQSSIPILRAIWVHPRSRKKSIQRNIFSIVCSISEKHGEPFYCHACPFEVPNPNLTLDSRDAWNDYFYRGIRTDGFPDDARQKQANRIRSYGLKSCRPQELDDLGNGFDLVYIPSTASKELADLLQLTLLN